MLYCDGVYHVTFTNSDPDWLSPDDVERSQLHRATSFDVVTVLKLAFHNADTDTDTNTDIRARILADMSDTRY